MKVQTVSVHRRQRPGIPAWLWWQLGLVTGAVLAAALFGWAAGELPDGFMLSVVFGSMALTALFIGLHYLEKGVDR